MNLRQMKSVLWWVFILTHLLGIGLFSMYYIRTQGVCDITLWADSSHKIKAVTPLNKSIIYDLPAKDSLFLRHRPWREVYILSDSGKTQRLDLSENQESRLLSGKSKIVYNTENPGNMPLVATFKFLNHILYLIPVYSAFMLLWIIAFIYVKSHRFRNFRYLKNKIFRYLLRGKRQATIPVAQPLRLFSLERILLILGMVLIIPVMYLHLGKYPFAQKPEEKRRALVSLEMCLNDNYIVPTTCGELYYNKPPLFNWLIVPFMKAENMEAKTRAVSVTSLLLLGVVVFWLLRRKRGWQHALLVSFMFLTSLHVLRYLSFILNVDALFALFLVMMFYLNYHFAVRKEYYKLFTIGYVLCALAFLTKGLPALYLQAVSLIAALGLHRKWRELISLPHLAGLSAFLLFVGGYFYLYSLQANPFPFIKQLVSETMIGSAYSSMEIFRHIISFPAKNIISFSMVGLLLPLVFIRSYFITIMKSRELTYLLLIISLGSIAFLSSPFFQGYYILIIVPLYVDLILHLVGIFRHSKLRTAAIAWGILCLILVVGELSGYSEFSWILILLSFILFVFRRYLPGLLIISGIVLMGFKALGDMGYYTENENFNSSTKNTCRMLVEKYPDNEFVILSKHTPFNYVSIFYLSWFSSDIIPYSGSKPCEKDAPFLYLAGANEINGSFTVLDTIPQLYWMPVENSRFHGRAMYQPLFVIKRR